MPTSFGNIAAQFGTKFNATAAVSLQQLLFDGQVFIGLQARKTSIDFQTKNIEVTEEAIKTNIYKIYYQLVVGKTQIEIFDANINRLEKLLLDTKAMFESGFAEKLDITNLKTQKASAENAIATGYLGLKVLMGMPLKDSLILTDNITEDQIKSGILTDAYQYSDRKDFQYAELGKKLGEFNVRRYKLSYLPTVALTGSYAKNAQRNQFDFFGKGDWFTISSVGLNVSVPIFSGFAKDARVKQAQIDLEQTNNTINNLKNQIDNEVAQANLNLRSAINTIDYQKQNKELAETVYNQTVKKYQVGTGSNTEITAAQTDLITAQSNYTNALYSAIIAKIDYQKAIGKL
jgi:outer membrane protein TolC